MCVCFLATIIQDFLQYLVPTPTAFVRISVFSKNRLLIFNFEFWKTVSIEIAISGN